MKNREREKKRSQDYRKYNKASVAAYRGRYKAANKENIAQVSRRYRVANRDKIAKTRTESYRRKKGTDGGNGRRGAGGDCRSRPSGVWEGDELRVARTPRDAERASTCRASVAAVQGSERGQDNRGEEKDEGRGDYS